jgi:hypothetical protein
MILVFDDQHNLWINVFASVCICSSQDAKVTWTKALKKQHFKRRHYEDHKWRSTSIKQKSKTWRKCSHSRTVRLRTTDCPVPHAGLSGSLGNNSHRTVRWDTWLSGARMTCSNGHLQQSYPTTCGAPDRAPNCQVPTIELSGVPQRAETFMQ